MTRASTRANRARRKGSAYILILGVSMILMIIGLSALTLSRVTTRTLRADNDWAEAQRVAVSGAEQALEIFDFYPCLKRKKKDQCHIYRTFLEGETISGERTGAESGRSYQYMSFITEHRNREYVVYRETDITGRRTIEEKLDKALQAVLNPPRPRKKR